MWWGCEVVREEEVAGAAGCLRVFREGEGLFFEVGFLCPGLGGFVELALGVEAAIGEFVDV